MQTLGPEAYQTALVFWHDFEKSAIHLPPQQRNRFVSLSSEILVLGRQFLNEANRARPPTTIKPSELRGIKDQGMGIRLQLQARFTQRDLLVYPGSLQAQMIMRSAPDEEPRRRLYMAANSSSPEQIEQLERLLRARAELARLVGRESFAHMTLADKMAKSPGLSPIVFISVIHPGLISHCIFRQRGTFSRRIDEPHSSLYTKRPSSTQSPQAGPSQGTESSNYTSLG